MSRLGVAVGVLEGGVRVGGLQGVALGGMQGCVAFAAAGVLWLALGRLGVSSLGSSAFVVGRAFCCLKAAAAVRVGFTSAFTPPLGTGTGTPPLHT